MRARAPQEGAIGRTRTRHSYAICALIRHYRVRSPIGRGFRDRASERLRALLASGYSPVYQEEVRFARDSPLEGGVSCELVSENAKIPC
jgi:hypothetical protein